MKRLEEAAEAIFRDMSHLGAAGVVPLTPALLYLNAAMFSKGAIGASTPSKEKLVRRVLRQRLRHHDGLSLELRRIIRNVYLIRSKLHKESDLPWDYEFKDDDDMSSELMDFSLESHLEVEDSIQIQDSDAKRKSLEDHVSHVQILQEQEQEDERYEALQLRLRTLIGGLDSDEAMSSKPEHRNKWKLSHGDEQRERPWSARPRTINALLQRTLVAPTPIALAPFGLEEPEEDDWQSWQSAFYQKEMASFRPPLPLDGKEDRCQPPACQAWAVRLHSITKLDKESCQQPYLPSSSAVLRSKDARSFTPNRKPWLSEPHAEEDSLTGKTKEESLQAQSALEGEQSAIWQAESDGQLVSLAPTGLPTRDDRLKQQWEEKLKLPSPNRTPSANLTLRSSCSRPKSADLLPQWIAKRRIRMDPNGHQRLWPHDMKEKLKRTLINVSASDL